MREPRRGARQMGRGSGSSGRRPPQLGLAEWVQEIRFTYWPLYAANQIEQARGLFRHYSAMLPYLERQTRNLWGLPGIWIPETVLPWGHAEDWILKLEGSVTTPPHYERRDPDKIPYGRFEAYNPYIGFLFTSGLEICHHYLTYHRYTGDERFLRDEAYPVLKGVSEFTASLMRKESDGRFHLDPANALETWWMVRDPADTLAGIRAIFPEFVRLSRNYGRDPELRRRCWEILAALPNPAPAPWPAHASPAPMKPRNRENPRFTASRPSGFPASAPGITTRPASPSRIVWRPWSMAGRWTHCGRRGWASGQKRRACWPSMPAATSASATADGPATTARFFPAGFPSRRSSTPEDATPSPCRKLCCKVTAAVIRILPAASPDWSGAFRLRAEGGFLISAEFTAGSARTVEIQSLLGNACTVENPWPKQWCAVRRAGRIILRSRDHTLRFRTNRDAVYSLAQSP